MFDEVTRANRNRDPGKALDTHVFERNGCRMTAVLNPLINTLCRAVFTTRLPVLSSSFTALRSPQSFPFFIPSWPRLSHVNGLHFSILKRPAYSTLPATHLRASDQTQTRRLFNHPILTFPLHFTCLNCRHFRRLLTKQFCTLPKPKYATG